MADEDEGPDTASNPPAQPPSAVASMAQGAAGQVDGMAAMQPSAPGKPAPAQPSVTPGAAGPGSEQDASQGATIDATTGAVRPTNIMERAYRGILGALGGTNEVQLQRDPNTGQMVATSAAKGPGAQWKTIISGALTGIAGAAGANPVGPGKFTRAAGAGIAAGQQQVQQQQQQKVDTANQDYDEGQKLLVRKAQLQQTAVQTAAASFSLERAGVQASEQDAAMYREMFNTMKQNGGVAIPGPDGGSFKNLASASQYAKSDPRFAEDFAHGRIQPFPHIEDGKFAGVDLVRFPPDWGEQRNDQPLPWFTEAPGDDGKPKLEKQIIPPGGIKITDYVAGYAAQQAANTKAQQDVVEQKYKEAQTKTQASEQVKNYSDANKANAEAKQLNEAGNDQKISSNAQQLVEGTMDPANLGKRSKSIDATLAAANAYSMQKYGKPFDAAKAEGDYKFATAKGTYDTLNYLNSLTGRDNQSGNLQAVVDLSAKLGQTKFPPLNAAEQWAKISAGDPQVAAYRGALLEVQDQIAKVLQGSTGGSTSDAKIRQASEVLDKNFNAKQMAETATTLRELLANRKSGIIGDNRYLQQWHAQPAMAPSPAGMVTVQINGQIGHIPQANLQKFQQDNPTAKVIQ
jgi:hypothetical protein